MMPSEEENRGWQARSGVMCGDFCFLHHRRGDRPGAGAPGERLQRRAHLALIS